MMLDTDRKMRIFQKTVNPLIIQPIETGHRVKIDLQVRETLITKVTALMLEIVAEVITEVQVCKDQLQAAEVAQEA